MENEKLNTLLNGYNDLLKTLDEESRDYDFTLGRIFMLEDLIGEITNNESKK